MKRFLFYMFFLMLMAVMLWHYLSCEKVLLTTDAAIRGADWTWRDVMYRLGPYWHDGRLLGSPRGTGAQLANILKAFTGGIFWNNMAYAFACLLASFAFLRRFKWTNSWIACLGALTACWVGTNFTLMLAGHYYKSYIVLFFICSLLPVSRAAAGSVLYGIVWGGCVGLMFVQQPDVALFFALFAGAYLLFLLWKEQGFRVLQWLKVLLPALIVAFLFAVGPLLSGYEQQVKGTAQMQTQDPQQKWDYVTQWSIPPDEVIDFVAPGYYGWRSGEPEGPYRGRMGRSPGWEKTGQGFQNFKLESTYIGIIPVGFAIFALFACRRSKRRAEILFWAGATVVALLLAFGKYFPLYGIFYQLPVVNNIRNPNKFIQVFQVCLAILAVYGFDALWQSRKEDSTENGQYQPVRVFCWSSLGVLVVLGLWALVATLGKAGGIDQFISEGWPKDSAETMVQNKASSLWHAVFMTALVTAVFAVFSFKRFAAAARHRNAIAGLLVLIVAADAVRLSKHYVKEMPRSYIEANALTDFLKKNLGDQRVALLSQDGINNIWITYLLPYNRIPTFNYTDMPRMSSDYKTLLSAGQRDPLGMWRFSGVKFLLGPAAAETQLAEAGCRKVFVYGLNGTRNGGFNVVAHPSGTFAVYELSGALPRYALFAGSVKGSDEQAVSGMSNHSRVVLPHDSSLPVLDGAGLTGSVEVLSHRSGKVRLQVTTDVPVILRAADRYDKDWKAKIDGQRTAVERVDLLCQGVSVPAGSHEVVLQYAPSRLYFNLQMLALAVVLTALVGVWRQRKAGDAAD